MAILNYRFSSTCRISNMDIIGVLVLILITRPCSGEYYGRSWTADILHDSPEEPETKIFKIGAFFNENESMTELALKLAIERFNKKHEEDGFIRLSGQFELLLDSPYLATDRVCSVLQEGITAIFGPENPETASHVQSICDAFEIPYIEVTWDHVYRGESYLFNLAPHPETLAKAYSDLVLALHWESFLILHEDDVGLLRLQEIFKVAVPPGYKSELKKLPPDNNFRYGPHSCQSLKLSYGDTYLIIGTEVGLMYFGHRPLLSAILSEGKYKNFIIDCTPATAHEILTQAQQTGLIIPDTSFIFTTLDLNTLNLDDFKYARCSIYAFSMIDPDTEGFKEVVHQWEESLKSGDDTGVGVTGDGNENDFAQDTPAARPVRLRFNSSGNARIVKPTGRPNNSLNRVPPRQRYRRETDEDSPTKFPQWLTTEIALVFDAVDLFGHSLSLLDSIQDVSVSPLNCEASNSFQQGYSLINFMKNTQFSGLTGPIQFNTTGFRSDVSLNVVSLTIDGLQKAATWDTKRAYRILWYEAFDPNRPAALDASQIEVGNPVRGRHLILTTIMSAPMMMWKISESPLTGNERYEGFAIDLVDRIAEMLGFTYTIKPVGDGKYGSQDKTTGKWNGMIREVMEDVAHIAVADLSVNKQRQAAVDLTLPFMSLGISILFVAPKAKPPSLLSFMAPMEPQVWVCVVLAIIGTSLTLFICARLTPYEWIVPHPCIDDPDELENEFTLRNCFFFTIGTYLCQGADIAPKCASTRMVAGFWWLFTLIMVSSYTANLATFLIVQDLDVSIRSATDLPGQDKVKYGCLGSGTTFTFFKTSPFKHYQQIYENMVKTNEKEKVLMSSNKEGLEKVIRDAGRYAFFMESTVIEYNVERNCKLSQVNGLLDNKGYAIALKKGSNMSQSFSSAVLKLQEKGILDELKRKWWKEERKENACDGIEEEGEGSVSPLKLANVGGIFIVTVVGCIVAIFVSCFELLISAKEISGETKNSMCREIINELSFAFSCSGNTREVRKSADDENEDDTSSVKNCSKTSLGKRSNSSGSSSSNKANQNVIEGKLLVNYKR